jgi:putative drug exporter of the RND superfamily
MTITMERRSAAVRSGPGPDADRGLFARLGEAVTAHPVRVAFGWLLIVAALIGISAMLGQPAPSQTAASELPAGYESARAQAVIDNAFGAPSSNATAFLVISRTDGGRLSAGDRALASRVAGGLARLEASHSAPAGQGPPASVRVGPAADSPNDLIALAPVSFGAVSGTTATDQAVANLRADVAGELAGTGLRAQLTGQAASDADNSLTQELAVNGMLLAILILLFLLFRSPGVPFLVVLAIYGAGSGVTALLNIAAHIGGFQLDQTTTSLLPVVLFGVGTDYSVFLLYRYRDRMRAGDDHKTAMTAAVARVGHAMVASALAVAVSFSAMAVSGLLTFRILGPSLAVAVLAMLATSVTLVPAVLALGSRRRARSARWTHPPQHAIIGRVAGLVARRPGPVALGAVAVLAALAVAALGYHASYDQQPYPAGSQSAAGYSELQRGYPAGALDPTVVVVTAPHGAPTTAQLGAFAADLSQAPGVGRVTIGQAAGHGRVTELDVQLSVNPESSAAFRIVHGLEAVAATRAPAGTTALVGGDSAAYYDVSKVLGHDMKIIFPLAGLAILLILLLTLGSVIAPLYLMASVVLGFAATMGASVLLFQHVLGHNGLDFQLPLVVYLFVASIGTDYNILTITRLREEIWNGASPRQAAATAIRTAGPAVAAAGLVLATSFALLMISPLIADIGFAVAAGVLLSAFINAFLLVPALTALAGKAAWWPSHPRTPAHAGRRGHPPIQRYGESRQADQLT